MELKKVTLALMALGVSGVASAAAYVPAPAPAPACMGEAVTVPCEQQGFSLGADFIYVQPTGLNYFNDDNQKWAPGVRVEGAYHFGNGNDVNVNFTWLEKNSDRHQNYPFGIGDGYNAGIGSRFWNLNAEFGQTVFYGDAVTMRYHMGMQYADIKRTTSNYFGINEIVNFINPELDVSNGTTQRFRGFGPRVGVDASYEIADSGFSLVGKAAGSLLVGDTKFAGNIAITPEFGDPLNLSLNERTRNIVPGLEAKLGGEYTFDFPEMSGELGIEAGYQWAGYFDSMEVPTLLTGSSQNDFGYHGIYVGLTWAGDFAYAETYPEYK